MKNTLLFRIAALLSVIGVLLAIYLLWQQFYHPAFQPCYINNVVNCDAVISGPVAKTFGLPTPLYGLIGYIIMIFAAVTAHKKLLLGMSTFGLIFCLYIAYRELIQLRVICPVCISCQLIMITVFTISIILFKRKTSA